nr:unnamed protein product [Callosobruchus chinensis]
MFTRFYNLKTKDEQDIFIQRLIEITDVQKRRSRKDNPKNRPHSYKYFVKKKGDVRCEVCLKTCLSILSVTEKRILRMKRLAILGMSPRDMRGKNTRGNALSEAARLCMREHIEYFPKKKSHYSGREVYYLDSNLNIH